MPGTEVIMFQETDGTVPLIKWLDRLPEKVQDKCLVKIQRLEEQGYALHRPEADNLRDGIHELRGRSGECNLGYFTFFMGSKLLSPTA